jgi:hypothetical protein
MTDQTEHDKEMRRLQRISFAYGNAAIDNPDITREMVEEQARILDNASKTTDD